MKLASPLFLLLPAFLLASNLIAEENRYSCSTDDNGKAVVLDATKPGQQISVSRAKSSLKKKKMALTDQKEAVKANSNLSKSKKASKLAALKLKLSEIKAALNIVSGCQDGSPGGSEIRTRINVTALFCNGDPQNNCEFDGVLNVQSASTVCAGNRTITITKENVTLLGTTNTDAVTPIGGWKVEGVNLGAGNYYIAMSELTVGDTKCAAALSVWNMDSAGSGTFVSEQY